MYQAFDLVLGDADRLFEKDADPAGERIARHLTVEVVGRRDMYDVWLDLVKHFPIVGKDLGVRSEFRARGFGSFGDHVAESGDLDAGKL